MLKTSYYYADYCKDIQYADSSLRDRSFFYERGGAGGIGGGGHSKKIGLKGRASRKKMKERMGGVGRKN